MTLVTDCAHLEALPISLNKEQIFKFLLIGCRWDNTPKAGALQMCFTTVSTIPSQQDHRLGVADLDLSENLKSLQWVKNLNRVLS